jgi:hypothetical protein
MTSETENLVRLLTIFMEDVKKELHSVNGKLDQITEDRRREARETGQFEIRISGIEEREREHREIVKSYRMVAAGSVMASVMAIGVVLVKLIMVHPETMK